MSGLLKRNVIERYGGSRELVSFVYVVAAFVLVLKADVELTTIIAKNA